jgi:hypothetical protein
MPAIQQASLSDNIKSYMRRIIAILLVLSSDWTVIAPAFAASPESNLPACCRRNGEHHCSMKMQMMQSESTSGPALALLSKCPLFPHSSAPGSRKSFIGPFVTAVTGERVSSLPLARQGERSYARLHETANQKRGPPSLLL